MSENDERASSSVFFQSASDIDEGLRAHKEEAKSTPSADLYIRDFLHHIGEIKSRLAMLEGRLPDNNVKESPTYLDDSEFYKWLKTTFRDRIVRRNFFEQDYVTGEPCWDMLLDLCISEIEGRRISVTSACIASGVPTTTALRWISLLERDGLIERELDPADRRRTLLRVTKSAFETMFRYFRQIALRHL